MARAHGQLAALRESEGGEAKKNSRHVEARSVFRLKCRQLGLLAGHRRPLPTATI